MVNILNLRTIVLLFISVVNISKLKAQQIIEQIGSEAFGENTFYNINNTYRIRINLTPTFDNIELNHFHSIYYDSYNKDRMVGKKFSRYPGLFESIFYRVGYAYNKERYNSIAVDNHTLRAVLFFALEDKALGIGGSIKSYRGELDKNLPYNISGTRLNIGSYYKNGKFLISSNLNDVLEEPYTDCYLTNIFDPENVSENCTFMLKSVNYIEYQLKKDKENQKDWRISLTNRLNLTKKDFLEQIFVQTTYKVNRINASFGLDGIQKSSLASLGYIIGGGMDYNIALKTYAQVNLDYPNSYGFTMNINLIHYRNNFTIGIPI